MNSLLKRFDWRTRGKRKLCVVPCHSCYIYVTWRNKEVGEGEEVIKLSYGGTSDKGGVPFLMGELDPSKHLVH